MGSLSIDNGTPTSVQYNHKVKQNRPQQNIFKFRRYLLCVSQKKELEQKIEELRKYKAMAEEISQIQKSLEQEVITYMNENDLTEEFTDSAKITYKEQSRKSLDKEKLKERLGSLTDFEKVTNYKVLRIK